MKFMMTWTTRLTGSAQDNEASVKRGLELFSKWARPAGTTFHQFVGRVDGTGGFAVVETDDPKDLLDGATKFSALNEFAIHPVVDIEEWVHSAQEGIDFRESIS